MLDGAKIVRETWGENTLIPLYDNEDSVCGIIYNEIPYYFLKNLQGDIIAICDKAGETVARYTYDAWGVPTIVDGSQAIATINPFRYRGYYYDSEIAMYYLQSRYYDPSVGRFVNSDEAEFAMFGQDVLSHNLFGYCLCSPIVFVDKLGFDAHYYIDGMPINEQEANTTVGTKKMKDMKLGWSNVAISGCGIIAAYNVLLAFNKKTKFNDVYKALKKHTILKGLAGIKMSGIKKYIESKKRKVIRFKFNKKYSDYQAYWYSLLLFERTAKAVIILYMRTNKLVFHYVAGKKDKNNFIFYNAPYDDLRMTLTGYLKRLLSKKILPLELLVIS